MARWLQEEEIPSFAFKFSFQANMAFLVATFILCCALAWALRDHRRRLLELATEQQEDRLYLTILAILFIVCTMGSYYAFNRSVARMEDGKSISRNVLVDELYRTFLDLRARYGNELDFEELPLIRTLRFQVECCLLLSDAGPVRPGHGRPDAHPQERQVRGDPQEGEVQPHRGVPRPGAGLFLPGHPVRHLVLLPAQAPGDHCPQKLHGRQGHESRAGRRGGRGDEQVEEGAGQRGRLGGVSQEQGNQGADKALAAFRRLGRRLTADASSIYRAMFLCCAHFETRIIHVLLLFLLVVLFAVSNRLPFEDIFITLIFFFCRTKTISA